jgi:hypothetical protein
MPPTANKFLAPSLFRALAMSRVLFISGALVPGIGFGLGRVLFLRSAGISYLTSTQRSQPNLIALMMTMNMTYNQQLITSSRKNQPNVIVVLMMTTKRTTDNDQSSKPTKCDSIDAGSEYDNPHRAITEANQT